MHVSGLATNQQHKFIMTFQALSFNEQLPFISILSNPTRLPIKLFFSLYISLSLSQNLPLEIAWKTPQPHVGVLKFQIGILYLIARLP